MSNLKNTIIIVILLIAAMAGFMTSKTFFQQQNNQDFQSLLLFPEEKSFSGFTLTDKNHKSITQENFKNKWTLLFFGFTNCPDVCPTTLSELQKVFNIFQHNVLKALPEVLFISVDPERDTPESLKEYIAFFNKNFNAATADKANILSLASQIGVAYHIQDHKQGDLNYSVDHTAAIFLINPNGNLYGIFRSPHDADKMAIDLISLINSSK